MKKNLNDLDLPKNNYKEKKFIQYMPKVRHQVSLNTDVKS